MKKVLLINGSNRIGNTDYILRTIHERIKNSELISLRDKNIEYCRGCLACHKSNRCVINDDMNETISHIVDCDLIIFGVPNYFDNVSGLFKNFIDRLHSLYKSEELANRRIIFIYVGGGNEEGTKNVLHQSVSGFIKYLKLNLMREYSFKALYPKDMENQKEKLQDVIKEIEDLIGELQ